MIELYHRYCILNIEVYNSLFNANIFYYIINIIIWTPFKILVSFIKTHFSIVIWFQPNYTLYSLLFIRLINIRLAFIKYIKHSLMKNFSKVTL